MYLIGSIVVAFLLGWLLGTAKGKSDGYAMAVSMYQRQAARQSFENQFNSMFRRRMTMKNLPAKRNKFSNDAGKIRKTFCRLKFPICRLNQIL